MKRGIKKSLQSGKEQNRQCNYSAFGKLLCTEICGEQQNLQCIVITHASLMS
jgi:hypothetical protein